MDYCVLGVPNPFPLVFDSEEQRMLHIGQGSVVYPWSILYEGSTIGANCRLFERSMVGSKTTIGDRSQLMYGAQVHDNVFVGTDTVIGGFIADNTKIGNRCSVFGSLVHRYVQPDTTKWDETTETGPTLEDEVVIGWGAVIVGPVTIGRGARIKPNCVVTSDVPAR